VVIIDVIVWVTVKTVCTAEGVADLVAPLTWTVLIGGAVLLVESGLALNVTVVVAELRV